MAARLLISPDAAAHSAKNAPTAPGVPNQPASDSKGNPMVEEQFAVYLRQTRERAVRQMQAAQDVMGEWLDLVRQCTETRLDSFEAEDVTADPAYREALRLYARVAASVGWFAHRAPAIEAGEGE